MLSCKQVTRIIASDLLAKGNWREKLLVRVHLLMCRHCRRYARQLRKIGAAAQSLWGPGSEKSERLERLQREILKPSTRESED